MREPPVTSTSATDTAGAAAELPWVRAGRQRVDDLDLALARQRASAVLFAESRDGFAAGRYIVTERVGAGGMGVVYAAYDPQLDRRIALKLLHPSSATTEEIQRRFEQEARALATLSHPNVVTIYDVGYIDAQALGRAGGDRDPPAQPGDDDDLRRVMYIAMEFVEGASLGAWSVEQSRGWREVLALFAQAGAGIAAVHDAGLVHRDIKPDNIMVGRDGRVRVMDFGLARDEGGRAVSVETSTHDREGTGALTQPGSVVGTPAYMAPEQHIGGPVDARTDQFGFCVTLWEALHGVRPFAATRLLELAAEVLEGRVGELDVAARRRAPPWVRAIVERGLAADPAERWPDMRTLLDALARDPTRARRRRFTAAGVVVAIVGVCGGAVWSDRADHIACEQQGERGVQAWAGARAQVQAAFTATGLAWADDSWTRIDPLVDAWTHAWGRQRATVCLDHLAGAITATDAERQGACLDRDLERLGNVIEAFTAVDGESLRHALPAAYSLPAVGRCRDPAWLGATDSLPGDPSSIEELEQLRTTLDRADVVAQLGRVREGVALGRAALGSARALGDGPLLVRALAWTGEWTAAGGDPTAGSALLLEAYYLAGRLGDDYHVALTATELATVIGSDLGRMDEGLAWARQAGMSIDRLGLGESVRGSELSKAVAQLDQERGAFESARRAQVQLVERETALLGELHPRVANALADLGTTLQKLGRLDDALVAYRRSLEIRRLVLGEQHPDYAAGLANVANALHEARPPEALALYRQALGLLEAQRGPDHPDVATAALDLGNMLAETGSTAEATGLFERALAIRRAVHGPRNVEVATVLFAIGRNARLHGDLTAAHTATSSAVEMLEAIGAERQPLLGIAVQALGNIAFTRGRFEEALPLLQRAVALLEATLGPTHPSTMSAKEDLAIVLRDLGRYNEAIPLLEACVTVREQQLGDAHPMLVNPMVNLGNARALAGDLDHAAIDLTRALAIAEARLPPGNPSRSYAFESSGELDLRRGRLFAAELRLRQSAAEITRVWGEHHPELAYSGTTLGEVLLARGDASGAVPVLEGALALRDHPDADPIELATTRFALARALWGLGQRRRARELAEAARTGFAAVQRGRPAEQRAAVIAWLAKPGG
jgi:eukaryotic-like serine/threonine-protein kinase